MSGDVDSGDSGRTTEPPRALTDQELASHYARERRRDILVWIGGGVGVLALLGLLAWQILRSGR